MKTIVVAGLNHETINACIFLASLDWQVTLLASADTLNALLSGYRFDKQVILLWQLYVGEQKITLVDSALETYNKAQYYWLCFEALSSQDKKALPSLHFLPQSQVIITGAANVGVIDALAEQLTTPWVYYLPLIFMKEGANFNSFFHSDLIIIGEKTANSTHKSALLQFFISHSQKQRIANIKTIEFGRMAIMGMLATRLSYINEMARLADELAVDIWAIQAIMGADKRIGQDYLQAGWGFGGKSLPRELTALIDAFSDKQVDTALLQSVARINNDQKELIFRKFWRYFNGFIDGKTVMIWGAAYRVGAGLSTNSAIHPLLALLWSYGIHTRVYAVHTQDELKELYAKAYSEGQLSFTDNPYALEGCDGLFIINWNAKEQPDYQALNAYGVPIFDGKNVLNDTTIAQLAGFYTGIGR